MDEVKIQSNIMRSLLRKIAGRIISKKVGKNIVVEFPEGVDICTSGEKGERLKATFKAEVYISKADLFEIIFKEE